MSEAPLLVRALRGEPVERVPVWLMRQAGRHLPGYRALRASHPILDLARNPELAAKITLEPVERYPLDAGVVFADITLPFFGLGVDFELVPEVGPVVAHPIRTRGDVDRLRSFDAVRDAGYVGEAIRRFRSARPGTPIVGFAGAPFTLASYLIEGRPSRDHLETKRLLHQDPSTFELLQRKLSEAMIGYLRMQASSGADALQLFDTWAGTLGLRDFERAVLPHLQTVFEGLRDLHVPTIYFSTGSSHLLPVLPRTGATALGVDWRMPLRRVREQVGPGLSLQGNLDPALLRTDLARVTASAKEVLDELPEGRGHVFNLGHGVPPDADPELVEGLVKYVREYSQERASHGR